MREEGIATLLLRIGVAFAFIYPAVSAYFEPLSWIGFFPDFLRDVAPSEIFLLNAFGIYEIIIALWILIARNIFIPSILAVIYLFGIVIFNLPSLDIIFRDISIMLMAVALAVLHYKNRHEHASHRSTN